MSPVLFRELREYAQQFTRNADQGDQTAQKACYGIGKYMCLLINVK